MAAPGFVLLSADYAQLELRMMAFLSQDAALTERLRDESVDFFRQLAGLWLKKPVAEVSRIRSHHLGADAACKSCA